MCSLANYTDIFKHLLPIFHRYKVGVTSDEKVIYWQHDVEGKCRAGKVMKYHENGHRVKEFGARWIHSTLQLPDFNLSQVPFGLHLLPSHPLNATVAVVESEKTARLAATYNVRHLNGDGFAGPDWSVRISLANLDRKSYLRIGTAIRSILNEYHSEFRNGGKSDDNKIS